MAFDLLLQTGVALVHGPAGETLDAEDARPAIRASSAVTVTRR